MKRKKIGLVYLSNYKQWSGGVIYIQNIISSLKLLEDHKMPELHIYHRSDSPVEDIRAIGYPYLKFFLFDESPNLWRKAISSISILLTRRSYWFRELPHAVYPDFQMFGFWKKRIFWIPDFQEYYLPHMWSSPAEVKGRKKYHRSIARKNAVVVFSSEDARNDFIKFYPDHNCVLRLLRFACTLPKFKDLDIKALKLKFGIQDNYFMFPNQFWKHKNHKLMLEAIAMLKFKDLDFQVVFTGSESDHRNREHSEALHRFVNENQIQRWVKFLGFIDRAEQLKLMDNAIAIIQASLFEGWSTVVEDAKALSQHIVLSDLKVHKEQITENSTFFDPHSSLELALIIEDLAREAPMRMKIDYSRNIKNFAENFIEVIN